VLTGLFNFRVDAVADVDDDVWNSIRIKIVRPPWQWDSEGYFPGGYVPNECWQNGGDKTTQEFQSTLITLPANLAIANLQVRFWFENKICRTECAWSDEAVLVDTGNPSGASGLEIITHAVDSSVPSGQMKFRFYRDTVNYQNIYAIAFWISSALPAEGPYDVERDAFASKIIETGTCTITDGDKNIVVTRVADPDVLNKIIMIFTDDSDPDSDLDGEIITAEDVNSLSISSPFHKSGTFSYAVIEPWWDTLLTDNLAYYQFAVPSEIGGDVEVEQWETPLMPLPTVGFCVTGCSRNPFGLGTRMIADSSTIVTSGELCITLVDAATIIANGNLIKPGTLLVVSVNGDRILGNSINAKCGQEFKYRIINNTSTEVVITLDTKYRVGTAFPVDGPFAITE